MTRAQKALNVLRRGLKRLEKGWCQEQFAKDKEGLYVDPGSSKACRWCLLGSIGTSCGVDEPGASDAKPYIQAEIDKLHGYTKSVVSWNDDLGRKKSSVLAVVRRAIKQAEKVRDAERRASKKAVAS